MPVIELQSVSKVFGDVKALDNVSFSVAKGEIFGFLGPNGAGKTTTIRILTGILAPTSGAVKVLGYDPISDAKKVKERIGVVLQQPSYEFSLSVEKALHMYGILWRIPKDERTRRINELMKIFELEPLKKRICHDLSIGQRRKLQVAREFLHDMDILFLDEPTLGLDPIARRSILDFVKEKVKEGLTVFFTTHVLEEAEYLCNRVGIIHKGRILALDYLDRLKQRFAINKMIELVVNKGSKSHDKFMRLLSKEFQVTSSLQEENDKVRIRIVTKAPVTDFRRILDIAGSFHLEINNLGLHEPSLEEIFVEAIRENDCSRKEGNA